MSFVSPTKKPERSMAAMPQMMFQRPEHDDHDAGESQPALATACPIGPFGLHEMHLSD
jgi:hypothetical protein